MASVNGLSEMSQVLTGDVMPDTDQAHEGLQQSLEVLGDIDEGVGGYVPVACRSAGARLRCSWYGRGAQKDQENHSR